MSCTFQAHGLAIASAIEVQKIITQEEIGSSSWFGFSLIANGKDYNSGALLRRRLEDLGFDILMGKSDIVSTPLEITDSA